MSQENVKTLGAFYEAYTRRGEIDDVLPYLDPEVVCRPGVRPPDDSTEEYVGREAYREFWVSIVTGPWEAVVVEPKEVVEAEDGRVLSVDLWRLLGRDGIEIERELPDPVHLPRRADRADRRIHRQDRCPRSRWTVGVSANRRLDEKQ